MEVVSGNLQVTLSFPASLFLFPPNFLFLFPVILQLRRQKIQEKIELCVWWGRGMSEARMQ